MDFDINKLKQVYTTCLRAIFSIFLLEGHRTNLQVDFVQFEAERTEPQGNLKKSII